jgi:hypothetical protein
MKANKNILAISIFCICINAYAQNLVPNPSFEIYTLCPDTPNEISRATGWSSYRESPDYYNSCATSGTTQYVPMTWYGYQQAASGNAFAGIGCHGSQGGADTIFREYIGAQLSTMLTIGQKYYVSFKVNLGDLHSLCASNNLGIIFSTVPYSHINSAPIRNFAHVFTTAIITDTANWTTISGSIIADSAYQYIIIGNFFDNLHTSVNVLNSTTYPCGSYYFIDDICVSTDMLTCGITGINENEKANENISLFPNPTSGIVTIEYTLPQGETKGELIIYDIAGAEVKRVAVTNSSGKIILDNSALQSGTYFYQLSTSKGSAGIKKMIVVK